MDRLAKLFVLNRAGLNLKRGAVVFGGMLVPFVVLTALDQQQYFLPAAFATLFAAMCDPGGEYRTRVQMMAGMAVAGALLTGLGFAAGARGWGLVVLAAFVVTLAAGLMVKFGGHRFFAAVLLNVWFIVALGLPTLFHLNRVTVHAWSQALAWLITSAFWIVITCGLWLIRGRGPQPTHFPEIPGDTTIRALTRPIILYAVIRAVAVSAAVAIAFGLHLHYAFWMPLSTVVAMKPSLQQGTLAVEQRLVGTILGAAVAALLLLTVHDKHALDVVIVVLGGLAGSIFTVNFALFTAALTALILTALDLPDPTNFATEGKRVLFTFVGVGIAAIVMLLADQFQKHQTPAAPTDILNPVTNHRTINTSEGGSRPPTAPRTDAEYLRLGVGFTVR